MPELRYSIIIMQIISEELFELIGSSLALCAVTHYFLQEVIFPNFGSLLCLRLYLIGEDKSKVVIKNPQ